MDIERFRCRGCGRPIGVYEPIVVEDGGGARITSCAAEPELLIGAAECYHRACYEAVADVVADGAAEAAP